MISSRRKQCSLSGGFWRGESVSKGKLAHVKRRLSGRHSERLRRRRRAARRCATLSPCLEQTTPRHIRRQRGDGGDDWRPPRSARRWNRAAPTGGGGREQDDQQGCRLRQGLDKTAGRGVESGRQGDRTKIKMTGEGYQPKQKQTKPNQTKSN